MQQRLILKNFQSPGDILMLTAAVRDLHRTCPGRFATDVRTSAPAIWEHNPYLTPLDEQDPAVECIDLGYPLIHRSNGGPHHFIQGFIADLESRLGLSIPLTEFRGDIHLTDQEKNWICQVHEKEIGHVGPFWIMVAGGKYDFTAKWWNPDYAQQVVDYFQGAITFVQCGQTGHWHPPLKGVINLVGKTDLRQFIRLMYHAAGVVCPVTFAMHAAAAVPTADGRLRKCVVIAGGREPVQWEQYPGHQFLHTIGSLDCCSHGGCWKSRCQKVGDGDPKDEKDLCEMPVDVRQGLRIARCMSMIEASDVIRAVERSLGDGTRSPYPLRAADSRVPFTKRTPSSAVRTMEEEVRTGIVIGHYNQPDALRLNIAAIRHHCGADVPILISDDCSDGFAPTPGPGTSFGKLIQLTVEDSHVYLWPNPQRIGHAGGDMSAFWKGIVWGNHAGLDVVFKLSHRFIVDSPRWAQQWAHALIQSGKPVLGRSCQSHGWSIRTEAVGMLVRAWHHPGILAHLTPRAVKWPVEMIIWDDVRDRLGSEMLEWTLLSPGRSQRAGGYLFREANSSQEYHRLAERLGVTIDPVPTDSSPQLAGYQLG